MLKKYFYSVLSATIILIFSLPSICQSNYYWHDITIPFKTNLINFIAAGKIVVIEVDIPEFIKKYEEIPLIIEAEGGAAYHGNRKRKILRINEKAEYYFSVPLERKVTCKVNIKTQDLKIGRNKFQFTGPGTAIESGYSIAILRVDTSELKNFDLLLNESKKANIPKIGKKPKNKDVNTPEIIITSHDASRGIKIVQNQKLVKISGRVIDESGIVEVLVNNKEAIFDIDGNFEANVYLGLGENEIKISAMDTFENRSNKYFTIVRESTPSIDVKQKIPVTKEDYYALIIGNNNYKYLSKLQTAVKDAKAIELLLKRQFGFKTTLLIDVGRNDIISALNNFRKQLKSNDNFLIYYAGHGEFDKIANKAYWLPIDAKRDDDTNWIIADTITSNIKRFSSNHIIIVSDSCYSGTFTRRSSTNLISGKTRNRYLEKMRNNKSRTLLASGGNEPVSDIGGEGHSVFASAFIHGLKYMDLNVFTAEELYYQHIKELVAGGSEQTPEYNIIRNSGHMGGDFYFKKAK